MPDANIRVDTWVKTTLRQMKNFYKKKIKNATHHLIKKKRVTTENLIQAVSKVVIEDVLAEFPVIANF